MLSSFLKKLLFARQFFMIDGKIEILGKKQVLLPASVLKELDNNPSPSLSKSVRNSTKHYKRG